MIYWIIHIILLCAISYIAFRSMKGDFPIIAFWGGLILKLVAGLILGHIFYKYYGTGDTISFFDLANEGNLSTWTNEPRTQFFITLLTPLVRSTGGSYWIASIWLSFISFIGCWYSVVILSKIYPNIKNVIAACFLCIPSIVFWSSGLLKDSVSFAAFIITIILTIKFYKGIKFTLIDLIILLLGCFLLLKIKHYLLITYLIFLGIILSTMIFRKFKGKLKWIAAFAILLVALGATQIVHPYLKINRIAWTLYENNKTINEKSSSNHLDIVIEDDSWISVIREIPGALHAGLFRPNVLDKTPIWGWVHKIENLALSILLFLSILLVIKLKPPIDWPLFLASAFCILLLAALLPLSTPNFGTLVRYKNTFMPFLFLICSILPYQYFTSQSDE